MKISIVIPTYNRNDSVVECVKGLAHKDLEIIVVDDGSPEPVILPKSVRVIRHEQNRGRAAARNTGMRAAMHNLVLMLDEDVFAAPDMVSRLLEEHALIRHPGLVMVGRVVWHPRLPLTLTMRWLQEYGPFRELSSDTSGPLSNFSSGNTLLWRPFILQHGAFDEQFTSSGLEDVELGLRLKKHGMQVQLVASAVGYHYASMGIRDLVRRELEEGVSAAYLHSKFPECVPQAEDGRALERNEALATEVEAIVEELALLEEGDVDTFPPGAEDLFGSVYRHYFLRGIQNGLNEMGSLKAKQRSTSTLAIYDQAAYLKTQGDLDEARRLFRLVMDRPDQEYWAGAAYHMGCIERQLGNPKIAQAHLMECIRLNPGHEEARQLLQEDR